MITWMRLRYWYMRLAVLNFFYCDYDPGDYWYERRHIEGIINNLENPIDYD